MKLTKKANKKYNFCVDILYICNFIHYCTTLGFLHVGDLKSHPVIFIVQPYAR